MLALYLFGLFAAGIGSVMGQAYTACDPMNATCPADPALGTEHTWDMATTMDPTIWNMTAGTTSYNSNGTELSILGPQGSTTMQSTFYINFGIVESWVKMAPGGGVVSSIVLLSDDLDEIDWEWVGYNTSAVQSNYFGKGNTTSYDRGGTHLVANADTEFHNYTTHWTKDQLQWWIDGQLVRTLLYADAVGGTNYPQTPCHVSYSIWPAGDPSLSSPGTVQWAGGPINYGDAPFTMQVQKVRIHDFGSGKEYVYTDHSGSWQSIKSIEGNSTAVTELNKPPPLTLAQKWANLPSTVRIGVESGAAGLGLLLLCGFLFFCFSQRKKGRLEHALEDAKYNAERTEMLNYQRGWKESQWQQQRYA